MIQLWEAEPPRINGEYESIKLTAETLNNYIRESSEASLQSICQTQTENGLQSKTKFRVQLPQCHETPAETRLLFHMLSITIGARVRPPRLTIASMTIKNLM